MNDAVVAAHGEDGGFDAVIWAFERGYSGDQLIAGALDGRLEADGVITDTAGGTEPPDGSPLGLIVLPDLGPQGLGIAAVPAVYRTDLRVVATFQAERDIEEILRSLNLASGVALARIIGAALGGYSGQQILENIIFEGGRIDDRVRFGAAEGNPPFSCYFLRDSNGNIVVPAVPDIHRGACRDAATFAADKQKAERDAAADAEAEGDDSSAAGGTISNEFRASGPVPPNDEDTEITSSLLEIDFCGGGQTHGSFFIEGRDLGASAEGEPFSFTGSGTGSWDEGKSTGVVNGSYSGTWASGDWKVDILIMEREVVATDSFGQKITVPIIDEPAGRC